MKARVRNILHTVLLLTIAATAVQAQPREVTTIPWASQHFTTIGDLVFFTSQDSLWRTDGTTEGTIFLRGGFDGFWSFREFNGMLYFLSDVNDQAGWQELWRSDGTPEGTIGLKSSSAHDIVILQPAGGYLYFVASDHGTGRELYRTNGTPAGTALVYDINPGTANGLTSYTSAAVGDNLFFAADNGTHGKELWKTNGTASGTAMVMDINPGAADGIGVANAAAFEDKFYFRGVTSTNGAEPWVSDGTAAGTVLLKDIVPGPGSPDGLQYARANDGWLYFATSLFANESSTFDLWKTDGSTASTLKVETLCDAPECTFDWSTPQLTYQNRLHFFLYEDYGTHELWGTDGTAEGTRQLFGAFLDGSIPFFTVANDLMLFTTTTQGFPLDFYRSDGTAAGTTAFRRFKTGGRGPVRHPMARVGDLVFFADHTSDAGTVPPDDQMQLMQTDGWTVQPLRDIFGMSFAGTTDIVEYQGKVVFATHDPAESYDTPKQLWIYDPNAPVEERASFTLVNADTDEDIQELKDGDVFTKPADTNINIRYNPLATPGSVVFKLNDVTRRTETAPPYSLAGDIEGDYAPWQAAQPGTYKLTATAYSEAGGKGTVLESLTINFTIEAEEEPSPECAASGTILWEYWDGVEGNHVSAIPVNNYPNKREQFTIFEGPTNYDTNYGARLRGYICPPVTGEYTFWIASNDHSELWLSSDDHPSNKMKIASVTGATLPRQWDKYATQKSGRINLTAGKRYYIEALHKQGVGTDNIAVGWQLPDGTMERPVPGSRLSPASVNMLPSVTVISPEPNQTFDAPATVVIEAIAEDEDGSVALVEYFQRSTAYDDYIKLGEDLSPPYKYTWTDVPAGPYQILVRATDDLGGVRGVQLSIYVSEMCTASGTITREYWAGVEGNRVSDIPVDTRPNQITELTIFEGPSNVDIHYGSRIRGYICPPATGVYYFFISSNDHSELWLSTSADPADKKLIASVNGATAIRQWDKYPSQRSAAITLEQGKKYYIEALHKQGVGTDNIAVGWQLPDGTMERPIPGNRLSPFETNMAAMASETQATSSPDASMFSQISVYPNPAQSGAPELTLSGYEGIEETIETEVEIMNMTGDVVFAERISCGGDCGSRLMKINEQLVPGVYLVNMKTNGIRISKRLLVK